MVPKTKRIYSGLENIPSGRARGPITRGALVLEGGAFRALWMQGFLDRLMLEGVRLSCVIGVSAGALSGMAYVSGQIGYSARINLTWRHDSRYVGWKAFFHSGSPVDVGFITENRGIIERFDDEAFLFSPQRFIAVATNALSGETTYFEKGLYPEMRKAVRASSTMPYISPAFHLDGVPYFDGGCSSPIPYEKALSEGYEKIMVVRTRDRVFRFKDRRAKAPSIYRLSYPALSRVYLDYREVYRRECEELERLEREGRLIMLAPKEPILTHRIEGDMEALGALYFRGYEEAGCELSRIKEYFSL